MDRDELEKDISRLPNTLATAQRLAFLARETARILRRAAGLPELDDPYRFISPDEDDFPSISIVAHRIVAAKRDHTLLDEKPRAIENKLEEIRRSIHSLCAQISTLDDELQGSINLWAHPSYRMLKEALNNHNRYDYLTNIDNIYPNLRVKEPHNPQLSAAIETRKWNEVDAIPAAIAKLEDLEQAIVCVIERAIEAGEAAPQRGPSPDMAARKIAAMVATWMREVTGEPPAARGPYGEPPLDAALRELFPLLGIKTSPRRPADYARKKLSE